MKTTIYSSILAALCIIMLWSCGKFELETSDNGKLDGNWHLVAVDTLATGISSDMSNDYVFWSVQGKLLQVVNSDNIGLMYIFRFEYKDNKLTLYDARRNWREEYDPVVEDASILTQFGINSLNEEFNIETLKSRHMVLKNNTLRLHFKKM